jgi:hypothetical protein
MRYLYCVMVLSTGLTGCTRQTDPPANTKGPNTQHNQFDPANEMNDLANKYKIQQPVPKDNKKPVAPAPRGPARLEVESLWVPSGWMGDAPTGAVEYRVCRDDPHTGPSCEEWKYDPSRGSQGWAAVSYQSPENNFGDEPGRDLKGAYTHLRFAARASQPGIRVLFKSGGHTRPSARYPASYESTTGVVSLDTQWRIFNIPVGPDDSNVASVFAFVFTRSQTPDGCTMWIDSLELVRE